MNKQFHKRAIAAASALLTLTSAVTTVSATQKNEIALEIDTKELHSGDSFNLTVEFRPDDIGACGFTIDLHYDPKAVTLIIPDESSYNVGGDFTLVTNFEYDNETVRITGADLSCKNVLKDTDIAFLTFVVNDGYNGDIAFWTDVDTLVYASGIDFINADYKQCGVSDPFVIEATEKKQVTTVTVSEPDDSSEETTTTTAVTTEEVTTTTTASLPDVVIPVTTIIPDFPDDSSVTETESEYVRDDSSDTDDSSDADTDESSSTTDSAADTDNEDYLFTHEQGGTDYTNEDPLQFTFSPSDFISGDESGTVDISVGIVSTNTVVGGIGMQTSEGWTVFESEESVGETVWTAEDVDLSDVYGDIAVQVYYLSHDSTFAISSVSIVPSGTASEAADDTSSETADPSSETDSSSEEQTDYSETSSAEDTSSEESYDSADVQTAESTADSSFEESSETSASLPDADSSSQSDSSDSSSTDSTASVSDSTSSGESSAAADDTTSSESTSSTAGTSTTTGSSTDSKSSVETVVSTAKTSADSNPGTGKKVAPEIIFAGGLVLVSLGQICYSIHSLRKLNKRNK
ncbi:hypothetical protein SAMN02910447_02525 [Ruminococcus sp. YE71]|uniref:hypothetical protein n=1 Tax=unclassified Ruminococcus TaxID=2608920 RepID=UPI00088BE565|nr:MULTISPECIES: hypothetical protein [unclassified Ruminococcus]SDA24448.1 hypothetical protein SAMN02910446_02392 [Ruminococcus sp. YE78]SFW42031.1 hypothetical protein SAMN02910447_02525 [Ruminococcus sp. YE71]